MRLPISSVSTLMGIFVFLLSMKAHAQFYCATRASNTCSPTCGAAGNQPAPNYYGFWPTRTIAVVFSPQIPNDLKAAAREAIGNVALVSGYNFFECQEDKIANKFNYMYIDHLLSKDLEYCWSEIGNRNPDNSEMKVLYEKDYLKFPNRLPVSIGGPACNASRSAKGGIQHEILHRLGLPHEHAHPDRDRYLEPLPSELKRRENQYLRPKAGSVEAIRFKGPGFTDTYDLVSIMHYKYNFFTEKRNSSANDRKTPLDKLIESKYINSGLTKVFEKDKLIGQRVCVSSEDARFLQFLSSGLAPNLPCDKFCVSAAANACTPILPAVPTANSNSVPRTALQRQSNAERR